MEKIIKKPAVLILCMVIILSSAFCLFSSDKAYGEPEEGGGIVEDPDPSLPETPVIPDPQPEEPSEPEISPPSSGGQTTPSESEAETGNGVSANVVDTRLQELAVSCGQLVPEFSPDRYEYTVYVYKNADDKSIESTAEAINSEVTSIRAEGATEFSDKDVEKKIIVEGPNGEYSEYLINVHIIKDTELLVENILYSLSGDFNVSALPGSFKKAEVDFKGQKVTAAQSSNSSLTLLYFFNEESSGALWYALDRNKGNIYPVQIKESEGEKYILISIDGAFAYGENGFSLMDSETGEFLLTLTDGYDIESDESVLKSTHVIILTLGVAITIVCICVFLWIKGKKGATPNEAQNKYFRPYIHLEDSQEDIEAKYEEDENGKEF